MSIFRPLPLLLVIGQCLWLAFCKIEYVTGLETAKSIFSDSWMHTHHLNSRTKKQTENFIGYVESENINSILLRELDARYSHCNGVDLRELTIVQVQELFARNLLTSTQLTSCYLQRIDQMNPFLKAVLEVNPNAMSEAFQADMERRYYQKNGGNPHTRSPMHGIPVLLKDSIATKDFMETTAGSWALLGIRPKKDADVVRRLRKAGAVIIGKANLSEFSGLRSGAVGWSGRGGQTKNPYNLAAEPYGSSSGSAVGIAANLAMVSIGEETQGSLISPASVASITTLKPTVELVSTEGLIPVSHSRDCVGPMARSMLDLTILFDEMVPQSTKDELACGGHGSYLKCLLNERNFKKFRVGIITKPYWTVRDPHLVLKSQLPQLEKMINQMQISQHFELIDVGAADFSRLSSISLDSLLLVIYHESKYGINNYLRDKVVSQFSEETGRRIGSLKDINQFIKDYPEGDIPGPDELILAEATDGIQNKTYLETLHNNQNETREFLSFYLQKYELDALLFPLLFPEDFKTGNSYEEDLEEIVAPFIPGFCLAAVAGYPSMSIPAGFHARSGVPFGVNLVGMPYAEAKLLQIGYLMEQMNQIRRPPTFRDSF